MEFDTEKFIVEVKNRPALWDLSTDDYSNRNLKKKSWEEITELFGGNEATTEKEKNELCLTLQKKWRNIKDSFNRENRRMNKIKSGSAAGVRKSPYIYYNLLTFLKSNNPPTQTHTNISPTRVQSAPPPEEELANDGLIGPYQKEITARKKRKPDNAVGEELIRVLQNSSDERNRRELSMKELLEDEDRLFMMSLVKELKKVPENMKLIVKRKLIGVFEQAQQQMLSVQPQTMSTLNYGHTTQNFTQPGQSTPMNVIQYSIPNYSQPRPASSATDRSDNTSSQDDFDIHSPLMNVFAPD